MTNTPDTPATATPSPSFSLGSIDMTPTWSGIMPAMIAQLQNGTAIGQQIAIDELMKLAAAVDAQNAARKAGK